MFEEAGIRVQQVSVPLQPTTTTVISTNGPQQAVHQIQQQQQEPVAAAVVHTVASSPTSSSSAEVMMMTLNRLNAQEELDAEEDQLNTDFVGVVEEEESEVQVAG